MTRLLLLPVLVFSMQQAVAQVEMIAHRGASYLAPENTLASANLAWELGADAVEIDVYLSKDGKVIVMHDANTKRTTGEDYVISETNCGELRNLDAGKWKNEKYAGEKVPFLEEVIETVPTGKKLVVEIKCGSEVIPALMEAAEASGKKDQLVFISFGWQTIIDTKKQFPNNACYWLSSKKDGLPEKMEEAAKAGLEGVNLNYGIVTSDVIKQANSLGLEVLCWTVDDPSEAKRLAGLGVKAITTNRPAWLKQQMAL